MKDAGLYEHNKLRDFGQGWDVNTQHLHSEFPVTVPHGDGEHSFMVLLIDGQLLMGAWWRKVSGNEEKETVHYVTHYDTQQTYQ